MGVRTGGVRTGGGEDGGGGGWGHGKGAAKVALQILHSLQTVYYNNNRTSSSS